MFALALAAAAALTIAPGRQPQLDTRGNFVALAYGDGNQVWFASSSDAGRTFSKPVKVAEVEKLMLGRHRGPRVAIAGDAIIITAIPTEGSLLAWRSTNHGKTWSSPHAVNTAPHSAREGLDGLAANDAGTVFVTWLDDRTGNKALYGAVSTDAGAHWSDDFLVYNSPSGHVCECCHPSALVGPHGELYTMWRNWLDGSRDMWLAVSTNNGESFKHEKLGTGTWQLNACPMDGGDLVLDGSGKVRSVWRRDKTIYTAYPGGTEREIGPGIDANMNSSGAVVWNSAGKVLLLRPGQEPQVLVEKGGTPVISGDVAAWESDGQIAVKVVD